MRTTKNFPKHYPAIVSDGLWRKSLSAVRALGGAGFEISVMGDTWLTTSFWSRFTTRKIRAPLAKNEPDKFGESLMKELARYTQKPVLLPMEDPSLIWVAEHSKEVEKKAHVLLPPLRSLHIAEDKSLTMKEAAKAKIAHPKTFYPQSFKELKNIVESLENTHYVLKPVTGSGSAGIKYLEKTPQIDWQKYWHEYGPVIVQERVPAEGHPKGVSILMDKKGECVAAFAHQRLQQYPNSGGPSTDRVSIYEPKLIQESIRFLKHLKWRGIAMVEWKVDPKTGVAKLMEINPRFWGSLELAIRSGVNFPVLYAHAAMGQKLKKQLRYKIGVRCRWLIPGDILRYFTQDRKKRESFGQFLRGLPHLAEEWHPQDKRGFFATLFCSILLAMNPQYWKYVRRG